MSNTFTAALKAIGMTRWFIVTSWGYIVTKSFSSKVEYFAELIPAWGRFTVATYKEFKRAEQ